MLKSVHYGSVPQSNRGPKTLGQRPLFHSVRDIALIIDKTVKAGYGALKLGTILAVNDAVVGAADFGLLVPYAETDMTQNDSNAKAYLIANGSNGSNEVFTTVEDAYKFTLGDNLIIGCNAAASQDLGEITAVTLEASNTRVKITATANLADAGGDFSAANYACIYVRTDDAAAPFSKAVYILDKDIDTGVGPNALGANTSLVISNAILYTHSLIGFDAAAKLALGAISDGRLTILK